MKQHSIPDCLGPRPPSRRAKWRPPPGSWDTQFHVLGPTHRYPYSSQRQYTPPPALLADYLSLADHLGLQHALVVHANTQGTSNDIYLEAVASAPERLLAVVRMDEHATSEQAMQLHKNGVRGVRFAFNPQHGGSLNTDVVDHVLRCIAGLGWFVQLHFAGADLPGLRDWIAALKVPVLIDHLGRVDVASGLDAAPQRALLWLAERPHVWVKLSGLDRLCSDASGYSSAGELIDRLLAVAADRMTWGSDWPHTGHFDTEAMPDDVDLFDALASLVPDENHRLALLCDNPRRLLGLTR
jgi:predicted TIM-barrel fold metal-dependent hydrolase